MTHLISPVFVAGALRCITEGGPPAWRTPIFTDGAAAAGSIVGGYSTSETKTGSIEFGVSCVSYVDFTFTWDKDSFSARCDVTVFVNGVQRTGIGHNVPGGYSNPDVLEPPLRADDPVVPRIAGGVTSDFRLDLTQVPCGSVIKLAGYLENGGTGLVYINYAITGHG